MAPLGVYDFGKSKMYCRFLSATNYKWHQNTVLKIRKWNPRNKPDKLQYKDVFVLRTYYSPQDWVECRF